MTKSPVSRFLLFLPNALTLLNLIFGCLAVVYTLQNGISIVISDPNPENPLGQQLEMSSAAIFMAPLFIALAAVVDFFDGFVARLVGASSAMGKELDSLADVVSFGVAPAMIIYQFLRLAFAGKEDGLQIAFIWLVPSFVLAAAAAFRLARFNLDNRPKNYFQGVPVPSVGLTVACFPLIYWTNKLTWVLTLFQSVVFWYALVAIMSWLMVSSIPIMSNKIRGREIQWYIPQLSLLFLLVFSALFFGWWAGPITFAGLVIFSIIFKKRIL